MKQVHRFLWVLLFGSISLTVKAQTEQPVESVEAQMAVPVAVSAEVQTTAPVVAQTPVPVAVQSVAPAKFGYLSFNAVFQAMPEFAVSQRKLAELKGKYDKEAQRSEADFQRKFAEFLHGQKEFPDNIRMKRQNELQDLLAKSIQFKEEAQKLLAQAEKDLQADMLYLLNEAIRAVGVERGYTYIINTDGNACPFINPVAGDDVTNYVKEKLQLPVSVEQ